MGHLYQGVLGSPKRGGRAVLCMEVGQEDLTHGWVDKQGVD